MKVFEARIGETGIDYLKRFVIGRKIYELYSPGIFVEETMLAHKYIFDLDEGFLEIENQWLTTDHYLDYYKIHVNITNKPNLIHLQDNGKGIVYPYSTIKISKGKEQASPIVKILILEGMWKSDKLQESTIYDKSLIFYCQDKSSFSISAHFSIRDLLECSDNQELINKLINEHNCRYIIE